MRNNLAFGVVLVLAGMAWGQATAPATRPAQVVHMSPMADPTHFTEKNPEVFAILSRVPKDLLPAAPGEKDDLAVRVPKLRTWDTTNIDGKKIKVTAYGTGSGMAFYYCEEDPSIKVELAFSHGESHEIKFGERVVIEATAGKRGSLAASATSNHKGEPVVGFFLVVTDATITKAPATAPATTAPSNPPG